MADDTLQYIPNTILPDDPDAMRMYMKEELDKIAFTFNNIQTISEGSDLTDPTDPTDPANQHNELFDRDAPNAHPIDSITGLAFEQQEQDLAISLKARVFFGLDQPTDEESQQGDFWFVSGYD